MLCVCVVCFTFSAAKKLGGKLEVVSYHDEVEGKINKNKLSPFLQVKKTQCIYYCGQCEPA